MKLVNHNFLFSKKNQTLLLQTLLAFIAVIALIAPFTSAAKKSSFLSLKNSDSQNSYKLLILGDNGQVDFFFKRQFTDKSLNRALIEEWYKNNLLAEEYVFNDFQCKVKTEDQVFDLQKSAGLTNFENIISTEKFKEILNKADGVAFLGDIIYPETKYLQWGINPENTSFELPYKSQWRNRLECAWNLFFRNMQKIGLVKLSGKKPLIDSSVEILAGNHSFDVDVHKEEEILLKFGTFVNSKKKGFEKKDVLLSEENEVAAALRTATSAAAAAKDKKKTKSRGNDVNGSENNEEHAGDNLTENSIDDFENNQKENINEGLNVSSFISLEEEEKEKSQSNMRNKYSGEANRKNISYASTLAKLSGIKPDSPSVTVKTPSSHKTYVTPNLFLNKRKSEATLKPKILTKYPKFIEISFKDFAVQFIDFNSGIFQCIRELTEEAYLNCHKFNSSFLSFAEAKSYFKRLYTGISKRFTASSESRHVWKALRAHHPPVNSEDGDSVSYFHDIKFSENPNKVYNLINLMKKKRVNIFFGSHIHNAQVMVFPYGRSYQKRTETCKEKPSGWGCFEAPSANLDSKSLFREKCSENFKLDFSLNEKQPADEAMLYIFINGNSGRTFDALKSGKLSNGMVVWSRAVTSGESQNQHYGFSTASFTKHGVNVEFYEVDPEKNEIAKVSEFNLSNKGNFPKYENVNNVIESVFCKN